MFLNYREKFPIFKQNKQFIYFDSACTTLIPQSVLEAVNKYYIEYSGCHGRGGHLFNKETTEKYEKTRIKIQKFINASHPEEIIFTRNTTEGINLISNCFPFNSEDTILTSDIEHNSNLLPWLKIAAEGKVNHHIFPTAPDSTFDPQKFKESINKKIRLVSLLYTSNLTGIKFPIDEIAKIVHNMNAYLFIDAAQSLSSEKIDVQKMEIDIMASSLHKNFGPSGVGFLYVKTKLMENLKCFLVGGETIIDTDYSIPQYAALPYKFEAGLQNYAGIIGGGEAIDFIENIGINKINEYKIQLNIILTEKLKNIPDLIILGPDSPFLRGGICNFIIKGIDSFAVAKILSESNNIMLRAGYHCVHAWFHKNNILPSLRVSLQIYNTEEEILIFADAIKKISAYFR